MQSSASANNPLLGLTKKPVTPTLGMGNKPITSTSAGVPLNQLGIGQKALSPTQNIKPATNALPGGFQAPKVQTPTPQSTANGTQGNMQSQLDTIKQSALGIQSQLAKPTTPAQAPQYTPNNGLYGELITGLANKYSQPSQSYLDAQKQAQDILAQKAELEKNFAEQSYNVKTGSGDLSLAGGLQGQLNALAAAKSGALASQYAGATNLLGAANTQQQLQQGALSSAAGLAAPQSYGITSTPYNPATGQFGQMAGGGVSLDQAVNNVVQKLNSGQMTYADATSALGGYGQVGINALQAALPSGFNIAQSNVLAGQQGSITPALNYATLALNHAKDTLSNLQIPGQTSNIGGVADLTNWFSNVSGVGKEATRTKQGALAEARSAIQSVLASVKGGNPTEYRDQSYALLPDNATPSDIDAAIQNLNTLGTGKQAIYGNPSQQNNGTNTNSNQPITWATLAE